MSVDVTRIRADFPALEQVVHDGRRLVYLDNAATTLKPRCVADAMNAYTLGYSANIHRGLHALSERATEAYEQVRATVSRFLHASETREIVFTSGTTAAMNLVAHSAGGALSVGDEIVISHLEHHANIVPWQMLCQRRGCRLRVAPITDAGEIDRDAYRALLGPRTRIVSLAHVSNALGTVNPIAELVAEARAVGALTVVDAAQSIATRPVDVQAIGCDLLAFSGHKVFGPTGVGVLYGRAEVLERLPPFLGGGDMIASVTFEKTTYAPVPYRFEAGTPAIAEVIGLGRALEYVEALGFDAICAHEEVLLRHATRVVGEVPGVRIVGQARQKVPIVSFTLEDVHPHDIGSILDAEGIAVRAGHHCAQPLMARFGVPATARASFSIYNTMAEADALAAGLLRVKEVFA